MVFEPSIDVDAPNVEHNQVASIPSRLRNTRQLKRLPWVGSLDDSEARREW